jgi:hypothetical protein
MLDNKIANIVIEDKDELSNKEIPIYIDVFNYNEEYNKSLPTIFISYNKINSILNIVDILNKKIDINNYWTFSKREKLSDFHIELDNFINKSPELFFNKYNVKPFNFSFVKHDTEEILINDLNKLNIIKIYSNKRSIFVLLDNNDILSFDKFYFNFINHNKIINYLDNHTLTIHDKNNKILMEYKKYIPSYYEIIEKYVICLI